MSVKRNVIDGYSRPTLSLWVLTTRPPLQLPSVSITPPRPFQHSLPRLSLLYPHPPPALTRLGGRLRLGVADSAAHLVSPDVPIISRSVLHVLSSSIRQVP